MRIGCLQFAPQVGDVDNNLNRADSVLDRADPEDLDLLVLPELAFTGYNFKSLRDISPHLEQIDSGVSSLWVRTTALKHDCTVIAGYPETVDVSDRWPANPEYYNSALVVNSDGDTIANYRKSHLYYTDETWALEGPSGFYAGRLSGLGRTAMGICMDINPYKFQAPWEDFEFAHHALDVGAHLIVIPMAWLTQDDPQEYCRTPHEPDMHTLMYWVARLEPIIRRESSHEVIVVFANRSGTEDTVTYAGTSAVVGIKEGEVLIYGLLGRGDNELLVVDTDEPPFARLVHTNNNSSNPAVSNDEHGQEVANGHETTSSNVSRTSDQSHSEPNHPNDRRQREEPTSDTQYHESWRHETQAPQTLDRRELGHATPGSSGHQDSSALRSRDLSSVDNADHLGRYLDEHPSRTSSSNGYLNSHIGHLHDTRSSQGKTPDSLQPRQGSVTDSERRSHQPPVSTRKPTWGQLPQRRSDEDGHDWDRSDDENNDDNADMDEAWHSDQDESPWGRNNRHSIRSDVSVWNNFSGRSRPEEASFTPQSKMISQKIEDYLRGSTPMSERQQDLGRFTEPASAKKAEPSPRQKAASRARDREEYDSSMTSHKQSSKLHQSHVASGSRSGSARGSDKVPAKMKRAETFSPERHDARGKPGPSSSARIHSGTGMRQKTIHRAASIPIAMNRDALAEPRESSLGPRGAHMNPTPAADELPILRPASRSRLRERSDSTRGRTADAAPSHALVDHERVASSAMGHKEARQLSRGRQRMTRSALDYQPPPSSSRVSHSAQARRATPAEQADLSQFHLIEDMPSENCPVHGSRSRSAAGHRTGSRRRTSASRHRRHGSRDIREPRRTTHNTPAQQAGPVQPPSSTPSKGPGSASASRLTKGNLKKASTPGRKMTQSVQLGFKDSRHNEEGDRIVATEVTRLDMKHGPKTPVAMVLMGDTKEKDAISPDTGAASPFTSFGVSGSNIGIMRPRSAIL